MTTELRAPFHPAYGDLPNTLAIFPLAGALLMPRARLPLNIFEPRYLAMIEDALGNGRMIGLIQPLEDGEKAAPELYNIGCLGRISAFEETEDGRMLITLTGICRFKVQWELPLAFGGYRRVRPDYSDFREDLTLDEDEVRLDKPRLLAALRSYLKPRGIELNWQAIEAAPDLALVTSLSMICPFEASEKQALLEARSIEDRARTLIALLEIGGMGGSSIVPQ